MCTCIVGGGVCGGRGVCVGGVWGMCKGVYGGVGIYTFICFSLRGGLVFPPLSPKLPLAHLFQTNVILCPQQQPPLS